jgi:hypothetical protein
MHITVNGARVSLELNVQQLFELQAKVNAAAAKVLGTPMSHCASEFGVPVEIADKTYPGVLSIIVNKE